MTKYKALANEFRSNIQRGIWKPGDRLKTEMELSNEIGVSRQTVRQALEILSTEGLIDRIQGSGTYISRSRSAEASAVVRNHTPSKIIGLITSYMDYYIFPQNLNSIKDELNKEGYYILLSETKNRVSLEREVLKDMLDQPIDGLIVECSDCGHPNPNVDLFDQFREKGVPVLFINGAYSNDARSISVSVDDSAGAYWLTQRFIQEGCKSIGGIFKNDLHGNNRYYGCIKAIMDAGLSLEEDSFLWFSLKESEAYMEMYAGRFGLDVLAHQDAVVCYNDLAAINLYRLFQQYSYTKIPRIACFDNTNCLSEYPSFAALTYPSEPLGRRAAQKLLAMLKEETVESEVIPWTEMM